jgi:hypothetical protein
MFTGLNFKLDVGLYQLDQQVACQRIDNLNRCKIYSKRNGKQGPRISFNTSTSFSLIPRAAPNMTSDSATARHIFWTLD